MTIKNKTSGKTLSKDAVFLKSFKDKSIGLLDPKNPRTLIFKTHFGIHTFGLKAPIDILILDKNMKVIKLKQNLKPNRLFFWNPKYDWVIELPRETIKSALLKKGDLLTLN